MNKQIATFLGKFLAYIGLLLLFVGYLCSIRLGHRNSRLFRLPVFSMTPAGFTFPQIMGLFAGAIVCMVVSLYITRKYVQPFMPPLSEAELARRKKWRIQSRYLGFFHIIIAIILVAVIISKSHR